jgi:hypothetical protein
VISATSLDGMISAAIPLSLDIDKFVFGEIDRAP